MRNVIGFARPKGWSLRSALELIVIVAFSVFLFIVYLGPGFREIFELKPEAVTMSSIVLVGIPIISYLLIGTTVALAIDVFTPLKTMEEKGLVWGLIGGLVVGLVWGLVWGLVLGLVWGLIGGLVWGLVSGLDGEFG